MSQERTLSARQLDPDPSPHDSTVVFVPGLGLDARSWASVRKDLPGAHTVALLPSMGQPAPPDTDLRVERQAERLLRRLPEGPVLLVGHSAGCPVVVEAAARSSRVVGLVIIGPVTDPEADTWPGMLSQWLRAARFERAREVPVLTPQYRRTGVAGMLRGMDAIRSYRTDAGLAGLSLPVEIIRGHHDRIASLPWCSRLRDVSGGRLVDVEGAGHMVPLTHPTVVVAAVERVRLEATFRGAKSVL